MAEQTQQLDIEKIREEITEKGQEMIERAVDFAREKPHIAVGAALGIGWILGNGLPPRLIMAAARLGWKAALGGALAGSGILGTLKEALGEAPEGHTKQNGNARKSSESRTRNTSSAAKD